MAPGLGIFTFLRDAWQDAGVPELPDTRLHWLHVIVCGCHAQAHLASIDVKQLLLQCITARPRTAVSAPTAHVESNAKAAVALLCVICTSAAMALCNLAPF